MSVLVLLRHGQSQWNLENRFQGSKDSSLSERGKIDTKACVSILQDFTFDRAFSSPQKRALETLDILLQGLKQKNIRVERYSALKERSYGDLEGLNRKEVTEKYGKEQIQIWRRTYDGRPPGGESMADVEKRILPFFLENILPHVRVGENVLLVGHNISLRPLFKYLDAADESEIAQKEIGLCTPYVYFFEGEKFLQKEIREVPGIVTSGGTLTGERIEG